MSVSSWVRLKTRDISEGRGPIALSQLGDGGELACLQHSPSLEPAGQHRDAHIVGARRVLAARTHKPAWYAVRGEGHWSGDRRQSTLWPIPSRDQDAATVHGTQKPVECMRRPLLKDASAGQAVYEPFCGSGTSIIAAETCGPVSLAMELSPPFVDVALQRWQAFTGGCAALQGDGRDFATVFAARGKDAA